MHKYTNTQIYPNSLRCNRLTIHNDIKGQFAVGGVDYYMVAVAHLALDDLQGQRVNDAALENAL